MTLRKSKSDTLEKKNTKKHQKNTKKTPKKTKEKKVRKEMQRDGLRRFGLNECNLNNEKLFNLENINKLYHEFCKIYHPCMITGNYDTFKALTIDYAIIIAIFFKQKINTFNHTFNIHYILQLMLAIH